MLPDKSSAKTIASGRGAPATFSTLNEAIGCSFPSSKSLKSSFLRFRTRRPLASVTTTSTGTRSVSILITSCGSGSAGITRRGRSFCGSVCARASTNARATHERRTSRRVTRRSPDEPRPANIVTAIIRLPQIGTLWRPGNADWRSRPPNLANMKLAAKVVRDNFRLPGDTGMKLLKSSALITLLLLVGGVASAQDKRTGAIKGKVRVEKGSAEGVVVVLRQSDHEVSRVSTDRKGDFLITRITPGVYGLTFRKPG